MLFITSFPSDVFRSSERLFLCTGFRRRRGDPQAYLEYMHQAHVFATPRRFAAAVRSSFEKYYNVAPAEMAVSAGKRLARAPHDVRETERDVLIIDMRLSLIHI